jgi:hypothetical protein
VNERQRSPRTPESAISEAATLPQHPPGRNDRVRVDVDRGGLKTTRASKHAAID